MHTASSPKAYHVYAAHDDRTHGHDIEGATYEEAALAFVEAWHPAADAEGEVSVIVREADSGREQCFRVDLFKGDAEPCN